MFSFFKKKRDTEQKNLEEQISLGINAESLNRHSDAGREFVKAYSGYDGETQQNLKRSLKSISRQKINPLFSQQNIKQQAGFSAETLEVARKNADSILSRKNDKYFRVDDVEGRKTNETAFDITVFDENNNEIIDMSSQMKFIKIQVDDSGKYSIDAKKYTKVITGQIKENGERYSEKYPHGRYSVPSDEYENIKFELNKYQAELKNQIDYAKKIGDKNLLKELNDKLSYAKKVDKNLVRSSVSVQDAIESRMNPEKLVAKEIVTIGNEAGIQYAQTSALIKGSMSFARNIDKLINGEISPEEAISDISVEVTKGAVTGYVTGQANTMLASCMRNSSDKALRELGNSSAPAQVIIFTTNVFRIINDKMEGKLTDEECFHNIAKSGIGVYGSFKGGAIGDFIGRKLGANMGKTFGVVGGPVGAVVGSVIAGIIIDATYDYAVSTLKTQELAYQERIQIEHQCSLLHKALEEYRENFKNTYIQYTNELVQVFGISLKSMALALKMNDPDSFIYNANNITRSLGGVTQFETVDEFETFLDSDDTFNL